MIAEEKLLSITKRLAEISGRLAANPDSTTFVALSREYAEVEPIAKKAQELIDARAEQRDLEALLNDADSSVRQLAVSEKQALTAKLEKLEQEMRVLLLPKDAADEKSVILEVRAGTGGDEAALFAGDLFRMYERYAALHKWKVEIVSISEGTVGGFKEIVASISGKGVYARLKFESGVHRVQRVPDTETSGRVHTSAATVAVLPEAEEVDVAIEDKDLRIDKFRAGGAGGQHVNKTESAIRITHIPTGLVVVQQDERSQHRNKAQAMKVLRTRLYDLRQSKQAQARAAERKIQVGTGDRSERIRTYNFPQDRITDHRIELTLYKLDKVLAGEALDEIIDALVSEHQAELLAATGAAA